MKTKAEEIELKRKTLKDKTDGPQNKEFQDKTGPVLVQMSMEDCQAACKSIGVAYKKGYEERVLRYICSDESVDRSGDIIKQDGWDLANFKKNPVIMGYHDYSKPPVANALSVGVVDGCLKMDILFADKEVSEEADKAFRLASSGFMKAGSVGFNPSQYRMATPEDVKELGMGVYGVMFEKQELMEFSVCGVPCNANAIQESIGKGEVNKSDLKSFVSEEIFKELKEKEVEKKKETAITVEFTPEQMEALTKLIRTPTTEKAGAVLSKKNKDIVSKAADALAIAGEALKSLLELSEPSNEENDNENENSKDKDSSESKSIIDIDLDDLGDTTDGEALYSEDSIIELDEII